MENRAENSERIVLKGALILAISSGIVKILSAVYKIPLYNLVGSGVMGYYSTGFQIYSFLLTLATAGFPVAMSRMVATANAQNRKNEPKRIFAVAILTYGLFSLLVSIAMFFFSDSIAELMNSPGASLSIKSIAPAIFLVTVASAIKGYYQGNQNMVPTSVANLIEALVKLISGFTLAFVFMSLYPGEDEIISAGTILCGAISALSALIFLVILTVSKLLKRRKSGIYADQYCVPSTPYKKLFPEFFAISIPIMLGSLSTIFSGIVDNYLILDRFQSIGLSPEAANDIWGSYNTMAGTIYTLPTFIIVAVSASIIPAIAKHFSLREKELIRSDINLASRICGIVVFPIALGIAVLPEQILGVLYGNDIHIKEVSEALVFLCAAMIFLAFTNCFTGILQAINKQKIPVINIVISLVVKSVLAYILLSIPGVGVKGAAISTLAAMLVSVVLNGIAIKRHTGMFPSVIKCILKPFISGCCAAATAWLCFKGLSLTNLAINPSICTVISIFAAIIVYFIALSVTGTFTKKDFQLLLKSNKNSKNP